MAGFLAFNIPANTTQQFRAIWNVKNDISLLNVWPHMHYLGRDWEITLERPDGSTENLIRINEWNFNWQGSYTFPKYIKVPQGSVIRAAALYDNTSSNPYNPSLPPVDVAWGEKTKDEMFFLPFTYVDYQAGDETISLEGLATGDAPLFRVDSLTTDQIAFRLKAAEIHSRLTAARSVRPWKAQSSGLCPSSPADFQCIDASFVACPFSSSSGRPLHFARRRPSLRTRKQEKLP